MPTISSEYGHCLCTRCIGMLRTRRTINIHASTPQRPFGKDDRFCHCSKHPWGIIVNRHTRAIHRRDDAIARVNEDEIPIQQIQQYFNDPENADMTGSMFRRAVIRQRDEAYNAQFDLDDPGCDEDRLVDEDKAILPYRNILLTPEEVVQQEVEQEVDAEEANMGIDGQFPPNSIYILISLATRLSFEVDWLQLLDGVTRGKAKEIKEFFTRHFPQTASELPSTFHTIDRLQNMSGIAPILYDCCVNSCLAYTGQYTNTDSCHHCKEPRFFKLLQPSDQPKARKRWLYMPILPRLRSKFLSPDARILSTYRAGFDTRDEGVYTDIFDGSLYHELRAETGLFNR